MDCIFNEKSALPPAPDRDCARKRMAILVHTLKNAWQAGSRGLRVRGDFREVFLSSDYSVHNWLWDKAVDREIARGLVAMLKYPYIQENENVLEAAYIMTTALLEDVRASEGLEVLASAQLANEPPMLLISLRSTEFWDVSSLRVSSLLK